MRNLSRFTLATLFLLVLPGAALADCSLNGQTVPEGTRAGGLVCQNGQWVGG